MSMSLEVNHIAFKKGIEAVESLLSTDKSNEKKIRSIIRRCINEARKETVQDAKAYIPNDPRHAVESIRSATYKKILGGQLNIFSGRRSKDRSNYEPPRTLQPGQRGGNRVPRGSRTQELMDYGPKSRGMILRWLNSGVAQDRQAGTRGGRLHGRRGAIAPRNWFSAATQKALTNAMNKIGKMIEEELNK